MKRTIGLSLILFALAASAAVQTYVGKFAGDGSALSNTVEIAPGPNVSVGTNGRVFTISASAPAGNAFPLLSDGNADWFSIYNLSSLTATGAITAGSFVGPSNANGTIKVGNTNTDSAIILSGSDSNVTAGTFTGTLVGPWGGTNGLTLEAMTNSAAAATQGLAGVQLAAQLGATAVQNATSAANVTAAVLTNHVPALYNGRYFHRMTHCDEYAGAWFVPVYAAGASYGATDPPATTYGGHGWWILDPGSTITSGAGYYNWTGITLGGQMAWTNQGRFYLSALPTAAANCMTRFGYFTRGSTAATNLAEPANGIYFRCVTNTSGNAEFQQMIAKGSAWTTNVLSMTPYAATWYTYQFGGDANTNFWFLIGSNLNSWITGVTNTAASCPVGVNIALQYGVQNNGGAGGKLYLDWIEECITFSASQ